MYKVVVEQKIEDDTYYVKGVYIWTIVDDDNKIYYRGESKSLEDGLIEGRKKLKKLGVKS